MKQSPLPQAFWPRLMGSEVRSAPSPSPPAPPAREPPALGVQRGRKGSGCRKFFLDWPWWKWAPVGLLWLLYGPPLDRNSWEAGRTSLRAGSGSLLTGTHRPMMLDALCQITESPWAGPPATLPLASSHCSSAACLEVSCTAAHPRPQPLDCRDVREPISSSPGASLNHFSPDSGLEGRPQPHPLREVLEPSVTAALSKSISSWNSPFRIHSPSLYTLEVVQQFQEWQNKFFLCSLKPSSYPGAAHFRVSYPFYPGASVTTSNILSIMFRTNPESFPWPPGPTCSDPSVPTEVWKIEEYYK